ncbi:hypothetical protein [Streptomyces sp. NBC_01244]|uniref:hypothetical protein n=1 Tax=Streptomyces sp. NBC_01244 TaxID=2903797 RepID=UPI002E1053DF|nr:hypothetical protein OG247_11865 [Streptomyces sp. NBC_01244]
MVPPPALPLRLARPLPLRLTGPAQPSPGHAQPSPGHAQPSPGHAQPSPGHAQP